MYVEPEPLAESFAPFRVVNLNILTEVYILMVFFFFFMWNWLLMITLYCTVHT